MCGTTLFSGFAPWPYAVYILKEGRRGFHNHTTFLLLLSYDLRNRTIFLSPFYRMIL